MDESYPWTKKYEIPLAKLVNDSENSAGLWATLSSHAPDFTKK